MESKELHIPYGNEPSAPNEAIACRNGWAGNDGAERAFFSAVWNEDYLILRYLTQNAPIIVRNLVNQGAVSDDSCVEAFFLPEGSERYFNIEFNIACYINAARRLSRHDKIPLSAEECASIKRVASPEVNAPVEYSDAEDWTLTMSIPWKLLGTEPRPGMRMKGNFYACAGDAPKPYFLSWAPIDTEKPDFHRPEFFGDIILD